MIFLKNDHIFPLPTLEVTFLFSMFLFTFLQIKKEYNLEFKNKYSIKKVYKIQSHLNFEWISQQWTVLQVPSFPWGILKALLEFQIEAKANTM